MWSRKTVHFMWQEGFLKTLIIWGESSQKKNCSDLLTSMCKTTNKCHHHWRQRTHTGLSAGVLWSWICDEHLHNILIPQHMISSHHTICWNNVKIQNGVVVDYRKDIYDTTGYLFFPVLVLLVLLVTTQVQGQWYFTFSVALVWDILGVRLVWRKSMLDFVILSYEGLEGWMY